MPRSKQKRKRPRPDAGRATHSKWTARAVQQLRARMGLSQEAFADALGTTRQTIINWEHSHQVPKKMACRLLAALERQMGRREWGHAEEMLVVDPRLTKLVLQTDDPEATARALLQIARKARMEASK